MTGPCLWLPAWFRPLALVLFLCIVGYPGHGQTAEPKSVPTVAEPLVVCADIGATFQAGPQSPAHLAWEFTAGVPDPLFADSGLFAAPPEGMHGLFATEKPGVPVHDPETVAWYASANGTLVRLEQNGGQTVVADHVQGVDVDVRGGLAVSREPNDTIVLHRFGVDAAQRRVLLRGGQYFNPRFSPDGNSVLVAESRARGGHFRLVTLDGRATDLGQGYGAVWHPGGTQVLFSRIKHDGLRVLKGTLWSLDLGTGIETRLPISDDVAAIEPAVSPDGRWLAFVDALTNRVLLVPYPEAQTAGRVGHE